jgi:hypothetical protein
MYKGWARNPALAPRPSNIYCAFCVYILKQQSDVIRIELIGNVNAWYPRRHGRKQFDIHKLPSVCGSSSGTVALVDIFKIRLVKWVDEV